MNVALRTAWTQESFFAWSGHAEGRYEFDGVQPVAMTGGTANHNLIVLNLHAALRARLRGGPCRPLGPDLGVQTIGTAVRYPDALVTCARFSGTALTAPDAVALFEVLSPTSGRTDRIVKVREYAAIASARRYVIVESSGVGLTVLARGGADEPWTAQTLTSGEVLLLPDIGIEIPVDDLYDAVEFESGEATILG